MFWFFYGATLTALLLMAAGLDVRTRQLSNKLTLVGLVLGLGLRAFLGLPAVGSGLAAVGIVFVLSLILYAVGALGGGDGKLLMMAAAFLGLEKLLVGLLATAIAGGVIALVVAFGNKVGIQTWNRTKLLFFEWWLRGGRLPERSQSAAGSVTFPYALAIAVGSLFAFYLG